LSHIRVDAQVHVVSPDRARYPLCPSPEFASSGRQWFDRPGISAEEYAADMDTAGIGRAVLVQPHSAYQFDNSYAADVVATDRDRFAWTCVVDLQAGYTDMIRYWGAQRGARAVRVLLRIAGPEWLGSDTCDDVFREISRRGLVAQMVASTGALPQLGEIAQRYPEVPILLDHCAMPDLSGGDQFPNAGPLFALAEVSSVSVKLSSHVFGLAREGGSTPERITQRLVGAFGGARVMWASDYSVYDKEYSYYVHEAETACSALSTADRALVLGDAAVAMWWPD
jgi:predicted TIM-barrel fold metal-dependent hydrolase